MQTSADHWIGSPCTAQAGEVDDGGGMDHTDALMCAEGHKQGSAGDESGTKAHGELRNQDDPLPYSGAGSATAARPAAAAAARRSARPRSVKRSRNV